MSASPVLLIGAAGLVGLHLRVAFADRPVTATFHRRPAAGAQALDITDANAVRAIVARVQPDVVLLAAAEPYVERCEREPAETRRVNVDGARHVADAAHEAGALLVVFSSEYVFDGEHGPNTEDDPTAPLNEYGRQKVELEVIARQVKRSLICRTSAVFGWESAGQNFVCQLVRHLRAGNQFVVPNDQVVTPSFAPSLATAVQALVDSGQTGTFHVAGPRVVSRTDFARCAADAFDLDASLLSPRPTSELGLFARRPKNAGLQTNRLRQVIGRALADPINALQEMAATEPPQ
jgi:dTDP-4-dehydrorhamnose reductase